jgi:hypothetical protein
MNKSESIAGLAAALAKAQGQILPAIKDSVNPFFKSNYADLASVTAAIREPLAANGLSYVQIVHEAENSVAIETVLMHASGEWLSGGVIKVPVVKHDAQGYGLAITYARRYSLSALIGVPAEDDDGNEASKKPPPKASATAVAKDLWESAEKDEKEFLVYELNLAVDFLNKGEFEAAYSRLQNLDSEEQVAIWSQFNGDQKKRLKNAGEAIKLRAAEEKKSDAQNSQEEQK